MKFVNDFHRRYPELAVRFEMLNLQLMCQSLKRKRTVARTIELKRYYHRRVERATSRLLALKLSL